MSEATNHIAHEIALKRLGLYRRGTRPFVKLNEPLDKPTPLYPSYATAGLALPLTIVFFLALGFLWAYGPLILLFIALASR